MKALDIPRRVLAVPGGSSLGAQQSFGLQIPDLGDRQIGELRRELLDHPPDRVSGLSHQREPRPPVK
ncbi:hypothetical protein SDC9_79381 [bioreactor metagenome]|uniref:Uncharacterized protein n=1 Tax=bioreactor metagenome TaxID=1076179 RepID=A0A644YW50_9ZZZZ